MKKISILSFLLILLVGIISCDNDGGTSLIPLKNGALSNLTLKDGSAEFIVNSTFTELDLEFGIELVYGTPQSFDLKALYKTLSGEIYGPVVIDADVTTFSKDYVISGSEIISAFSEINSTSDMNAGDNIMLYPAFTLEDGSVIETLNNQGETNYYAGDFNQIGGYSYFVAYPVVCAPQPGVYTIDMHDIYGDGWQTNGGNGGNGIKLILDGVVVSEFGMCSPYEDSPYACSGEPATSGFTDASTTVTIPEGTEVAIWEFPGDAYGEISFEIYGPNGELLLESGTGEAASGPLTVILCAE